jgi:hypothetical protein
VSRITAVLLASAAFLLGAYLACELAGLRDATSILSGTPVAGGHPVAALGLVYVAVWLAFIIACPILTLAGLIHLALDRLAAVRTRRARPATAPS